MTDAQTAERSAEPIRVTGFGTDAQGLVHLLPDHGDTIARCGFTDWRSYVTCVDWFEERTCPVCLARNTTRLVPARSIAIPVRAGGWAGGVEGAGQP
ncbi:hypothetical protein [Streptomyces erythrochromogenes]|uniref:hypothetical protein n=1 Tax=Streptomyces erythrochromogenes TaxID=285574 RepID=UPI0036A8EFDC